MLSKATVETKILPKINEKLRCHKTYSQYQSQLKYFKREYQTSPSQRIFGIFKSRFTIFKSAPPFLYATQTEIVLACAGLHNFLRKECRSDEFPVELKDESSSSSSLPVNEWDPELVFQTQEQQ
ncbi:hypothetical protein PRUPE_2G004900 [Prunus persica]|uniref:DDE Tnp4 domain-containing protein n=1 Tax=Prunus persica TaxID=3760 RepID=A0A251QC67_PRUPE|nr:hypothetical protein PRUPE_2G004900 [Prunus persica]